MRTAMLALAAGLLSLRFLPLVPPIWVSFFLAAIGVLLIPSRWRVVGSFLVGLAWACVNAHWAVTDRLPQELDGRTFWLEGQVTGLPDVSDGVVRFELIDISSRHQGLPSKLRLAWYGGPAVQAGEWWRIAATLKRPRGLVNPHAFDYEAWLLARRIGASGTIKAGERISQQDSELAWRDRLRQRLMAVDAQGRSGAIAALVVGDDTGLTSSDWRTLQDTGTVHLMVISGQHIGMLAGLLYGLVALLARWGIWPQRLPWLRCACLLAMVGALAYSWLAGFEVPVQRALVMVGLVLVWRLRFRHLGVWFPFLIALVGVLLLDPLVSLQSGFWLSFTAVALLALIFRGRLGRIGGWRVITHAQWSMALGLMPILLALGLPVSLSGPIANLIAVPLVSAFIVPLSLLGTSLLWLPVIGEAILWLAGGLLALLFHILGWFAAGQSAWLPASLPVWAWLLVMLGTLIVLLPAGVPFRALGLVLLAPLLYPPVSKPEEGQAQVWVLDVGQGLSVLVRTRDHALLYDAGPRHGDFDIGERVVSPSLRSLGLTELDLMVLSHADSDHAGGALAVQRQTPAARVVSGEPERLPASLASEPCRSGEHWEWNGVIFILWQWPNARSGNQASCVLLVEAMGERMLLTGDIDEQAEKALIASDLPLKVQWLLVPHHGSRSSSSSAFIEATGATAALVSRGMHNAFGHPHPDVIARLESAGVHIYDTAEQGALQILLGQFVNAHGLRAERRFWREK